VADRYPEAEWVPWKPVDANGRPAFWAGVCRPVAVVLHIMAGYATTARQWANEGHYGASWHFTVDRDGHVMQHLDLADAGYHAGIPASNPEPAWPLWRGHGQNVNWYTLGIEHEGFPGEPFTPKQAHASQSLCRWLTERLGIAFDRDHFPAHAEIDVLNRPNDFNTPELRGAHYLYLFPGEDVTPEDRARLDAVYEALVGRGNELAGGKLLAEWNANGNSLLAGYAIEQQKLADLIKTRPR
jgi:N-acetylmuramoyl-L-alanine amidase